MKVISLVSWKGGVGKTTLAFNLAERAQDAGLQVLVYDFDPQRSAMVYCQRRTHNYGDSKSIEVMRADLDTDGIARLEQDIAAEQHDLIICDTPGSDHMVWDRCANLADLLLTPVTPSPSEALVTRRLLEHGQKKGWNLFAVLNNLPNSKGRIDNLRSMYTTLEFPISPARLGRRLEYWDAELDGIGVCERPRKSRAQQEMQFLWEWVVKMLNLKLPSNETTEQ